MTTPARVAIVAAAVAGLGAGAGQRPSGNAERRELPARFVSYTEARPIVERLAPDLAAALAARPAVERDAAWLQWATRRNGDIRARLERGDEDSLVNLLLFGTSFTRLPRVVNDGSSLGGAQRATDIVRGRVADLMSTLATPGANERLRFVRDLVERKGIDLTTASGQEQLRSYIVALVTRNAGEAEAYARTIAEARRQGRGELAVRSTLYRARGLSSDTSIRPDFAIERTLAELRARGVVDAASVRRVALIGPGLDFTDKAKGHDFYPPQTTQPFSAIDSLLRLGLARADDLTLTTIDLSPRVNSHLRAAQSRAARGDGYVLVLPRERDSSWAPDLVGFWKAAGNRVGEEAPAISAPSGIDVRAVRIRPEIVMSLQVRDLNIVVERLDPVADDERFDLVIATNILVYYDVLEQSLALANIAGMLRPGGLLLSNNVLVELPTTPIRSIGHTDAIYSDLPDDRDQIVWYTRQ
jgi:hypothetical protein